VRPLLKVAGAAAALMAFGAPARADLPRIGERAPEVAVRALDGRAIDLAALRGRVAVVNVWATWCAPCRAEMPMLDAFYRTHRDQGVALVGLSADGPDNLAAVRKVMSAYAYPSALLSQARTNALGDQRILPVTYIVDRSGVVRAVFGANGVPLTEAALEAAVKPLL
jgi:cytochrome c biogenesis protein CcmG, thiol:disulfide interchange protein DsbE